MPDNNDLGKTESKNPRVTAKLQISIAAPAIDIFPLACPVAELKWIPNWSYDLVYSKSGLNEENCVFIETMSGVVLFGEPIPTTWVTTIWDSKNYRIEFLLICGDRAIIKYCIDTTDGQNGGTLLDLHFTFTAMPAMQDEDIKEIQGRLTYILSMLGTALKTYCETGQIIQVS